MKNIAPKIERVALDQLRYQDAKRYGRQYRMKNEDWSKLEKLIYSNASDEDCIIISRMKNITYVNLHGSPALSDLRPLASLANLKALSLEGCKEVYDLSPISGLTKLEYLCLADCTRIGQEQWQYLSGLINLKVLILAGTNVNNVAFAEGMRHLKELNIIDCQNIKSLDGIQGLVELSTLEADGCVNLYDITALSGAPNIGKVHVAESNISNIESLRHLYGLYSINFNSCYRLSDISPIEDLKNIRLLMMHNTPAAGNIPNNLLLLESQKRLRIMKVDN